MNAKRLLGLYPRRWRERYGDEFLATTGPGRCRCNRLMKSQPWKAQVVIVGGTVAFLIVIGYVAAIT